LLLIGFAFRLGLILALPGSYDGDPNRQDAYVYDSLATNLLRGFGYAINRESVVSFQNCPPCVPVFYPTPGYPLFLASLYVLFGKNYFVVKIVQALLDLAAVCLSFRLALRVTADTRAGLLTLALGMVFPLTAVWVTDMQTDTVATFFATSMVWMAWRAAGSRSRIDSVAFAIVCAVGILVRVSFLFLPLMLLSAFWRFFLQSWKEALTRSVVVCSVVALVLTPWVVRNYLVSSEILLATRTYAPEQDHVWGYYQWDQTWLRDPTWTQPVNWEYVIYPQQAIPAKPFPDYAYDSEAERQKVESLISQVRANNRFTEDVDNEFRLLAEAKSRSNIIRQYVMLPASRIFRAWVSSGTSGFNLTALKQNFSLQSIQSDPLPFLTRMILTIAQVGIATLGLAGIYLLRRKLWATAPMLLSVIYHTVVMELSGNGVQPRYLVYSFPVMLVFTAVSLTKLIDFLRQAPIWSRKRTSLRAETGSRGPST
jgi:hypothetical protein